MLRSLLVANKIMSLLVRVGFVFYYCLTDFCHSVCMLFSVPACSKHICLFFDFINSNRVNLPNVFHTFSYVFNFVFDVCFVADRLFHQSEICQFLQLDFRYCRRAIHEYACSGVFNICLFGFKKIRHFHIPP